MATCPTCQTSHDDAVAVCPRDGTPLTVVPSGLVGQILGERYRIVDKLGEGGMGTVYLAEHVVLGKKMAVKVLREEFSARQELVKRFQQEAIAASQIGQENIVDVTDFGRTPQGLLYFVMERLEGESLASLLGREGALPLARALPILAQVCRALASAHSRGIIHRDLKPDNIFITQRGDRADFVKVLDFGISKVAESSPEGGGRLTQVGMVVGTPEYMSPEQATGDAVDSRADVYAFGVLAYEMVAGSLPFRADSALALLMKHQAEKPEPPHARRPDLSIPENVEAMVLRALQKKREDRQQTMAEVATELFQCMSQLGIAAVAAPAAPIPLMTPPGMPALITRPSWPPIAPAPVSPAPISHPSPSPVPLDPQVGTAKTVMSPVAPVTGEMQASASAPPARVSGIRPRLEETPLTPSEMAALGRGSKRGPLIAGAVALLLLLGAGGFALLHRPAPAGPPSALQVEPVKPASSPAPTPPSAPTPALALAPTPRPAPPPASPPPAKPPELKRISLRSVPPGASVFGEKGKMGVTPLEIALPAGTSSQLRFAIAGYQPAQRRVSASDGVVEVRLARAARGHSAKSKSDDADPYGKMDDLKDSPY